MISECISLENDCEKYLLCIKTGGELEMKETKIIGVRREQGGITYITDAGTYIKKTAHKMDFYSGDPCNSHDSIHVTVNGDGSVTVYERINGEEHRATIPANMLD